MKAFFFEKHLVNMDETQLGLENLKKVFSKVKERVKSLSLCNVRNVFELQKCENSTGEISVLKQLSFTLV